MFWSYQWWDLALQDLILHCNDELVAGVIPYFNWKNWVLLNLWDIWDLSKVLEELEEFRQEMAQFEEDMDAMTEQVEELLEEAEQLAEDNPEVVRFLLVQMDWDTETTVSNEWVDEETDVTPTWLSGSPNWIVEYYVGNGYVTVRSSENETGIVRLRLSKAKPHAFLNHL